MTIRTCQTDARASFRERPPPWYPTPHREASSEGGVEATEVREIHGYGRAQFARKNARSIAPSPTRIQIGKKTETRKMTTAFVSSRLVSSLFNLTPIRDERDPIFHFRDCARIAQTSTLHARVLHARRLARWRGRPTYRAGTGQRPCSGSPSRQTCPRAGRDPPARLTVCADETTEESTAP